MGVSCRYVKAGLQRAAKGETHALLHLLEGLVDLGCAQPSLERSALSLQVGSRGCWWAGWAAECLLLMRMGSEPEGVVASPRPAGQPRPVARP